LVQDQLQFQEDLLKVDQVEQIYPQAEEEIPLQQAHHKEIMVELVLVNHQQHSQLGEVAELEVWEETQVVILVVKAD
jgi:hypothetical protein